MGMNPSEKQDFLISRKLQQLKDAEEHAKRKDFEVLMLELK